MRKSIYLFIIITLGILRANAQTDARVHQIYQQAESDYQIGRIEQARDSLLAYLTVFRDDERQNVLRLIALSYLARFDSRQTEYYASLLLHQNPYYSPSTHDPPAFVDIVNSIKAGMTATITTASSQAESLGEVPVPTTLITEQMIRDSGGRNLQEVLAAFVPGMNLVDCNDDINISMRGIYSNTQEKILIMLNGHRLNSHATNTAAPDFSMSLEKVKQIEVLRGPASSLYGGVALTAVVNIITKKGADVDGFEAKASAGTYGQIKADAIFGKHYFDLDLLVWGNAYRSSGEKYDVTDERAGDSQYKMPVDYTHIGRIGKFPSYDFGIQLNWRGLQFMYNSRFSQVQAPFTLSTLALSYDYDRYRSFNGFGPGYTTYSRHADLSYQWNMFGIQWKAAITNDKSDLTRYQVISDNAVPTLASALELPDAMSSAFANYGGISRYVNGQELNYGMQLKGSYAYTLGSQHKGNIGFGAEYGHFQLDDIRYQIGYDFEQTFNETPAVNRAGKGHENSADAYLQLKHQWRSLILNAGLRYDFKHRYDESNVNEFSPRVALILLRPKWNVKLSYSKSFVDAPFIYRKANQLAALMNNKTEYSAIALSPERVYSVQLSFAGINWLDGLSFEINGFYNRAEDLIMTHIIDYSNASGNKTCGVELMASYHTQRFNADMNLTWAKTLESNIMGMDMAADSEVEFINTKYIDTNNNMPAFRGNIVVGWQANQHLRLHGHLLFESRQSSYNTDLTQLLKAHYAASELNKLTDLFSKEAENYFEMFSDAIRDIVLQKDMSARAIVNLGAKYNVGPVTFGLDIHNLLGTHYYRSGMNTNLVPQQGRWFLGSIAFKL